MSEPVQALCAECRQTSVGIHPDTLERQASFNRMLAKKGEEPLSIHEFALCDGCYSLWQADRASGAAKKSARFQYEFNEYRDRAQVTTPDVAWEKVSDEFRRDYSFRQRVADWSTWYERQKRTPGKGAV